MPTTLSRHLPPSCRICSFRQPEPLPKVTVCHRHSSARQVRILQNVEYEKDNLNYLCPSCQVSHLARLPYGLNICISSSQLHEFHLPREEGVVCQGRTLFKKSWKFKWGGMNQFYICIQQHKEKRIKSLSHFQTPLPDSRNFQRKCLKNTKGY